MVDFDALKNKAEGLVGAAKEHATDERIDQAAEGLKKVAPDSIDGAIDKIATRPRA